MSAVILEFPQAPAALGARQSFDAAWWHARTLAIEDGVVLDMDGEIIEIIEISRGKVIFGTITHTAHGYRARCAKVGLDRLHRTFGAAHDDLVLNGDQEPYRRPRDWFARQAR